MKPRRALLLTITVVFLLCGACGVWLHVQKQQYARNQQLIDALAHGDTQTALALVNAGADPNTRQNLQDAPTLRLLLDQLLRHKRSPANSLSTALMMACGDSVVYLPDGSHRIEVISEDLPLIQAMLAHGANVNARTENNRTALHSAAGLGRWHTVDLLLQHGAEVNAQDTWGATPLMEATSNQHEAVVQRLLSRGANISPQDSGGNTALFYAVLHYNGTNILPELLAHGANPNQPGRNGQTPLKYARQTNRPDLVRLLERGEGSK